MAEHQHHWFIGARHDGQTVYECNCGVRRRASATQGPEDVPDDPHQGNSLRNALIDASLINAHNFL